MNQGMPAPGGRPAGRLFDDRWVMAYAGWVLRWRWAVMAALVVLALAAASGGRNLTFSTDYKVFFGAENPQLRAFLGLQNTYTKDDNVMFVLRPPAGATFTPEFLTAMRGLTEAGWRLPFATRVDSLNNFQHSYADGDELTVRDLIPADQPLTAAAIAEIRDVALNEPLLVNRLIAPDGATVAVNVTLNLPQADETEVPAVMTAARALAAEFRDANPEVHVAIIGSAALGYAFTEAAEADLQALVPLMYVVLLAVTAALLRSFAGTLVTLMVIGLSTVTAMGLAGWAGIALTPVSANAPTIILTIAIADSIHLLVTMFHEMRRGASRRAAIVESLRINFQPVFLTSVTTIIGFLSLNFSDSPPFHDLGNIIAVGVAAAWLYSILFLPTVMAVLPLRVRPAATAARGSAMDRLAGFVIDRRRPVLIGMIVAVVGLTALIPRLEVNDQFHAYFDHDSTFRQDVDYAAEHLTGMYQLEWSIPAAAAGGVNEPAFLAMLEGFSEWLRAEPHVVHVQTLTDLQRRLNRNMHGDDPAYDRLPADRELAAQYLLLFEMSLPYGLDLNNQINVDKSAVRVVATTENVTTAELRAIDDAARTWLAANHPPASDVGATGPAVMFAYIFTRNIEGMLTGTLIAFLLISGALIIALRNLRLGVISLAPNLLPAAVAFGLWSLFVGEVGLAASVITATSLGLIVDATVHFLSKYQRARRADGADAEAAVRYAFRTVGTALWVTSAILIAGFGVLALSGFRMNEHMGLLTAAAIAAAVVIDFLLLPALLLTLDGKRKAQSKELTHELEPAAEASH